MREKQIEAIRQKCIEVNPEILGVMESCGWHPGEFVKTCRMCLVDERPIRLADVALAIGVPWGSTLSALDPKQDAAWKLLQRWNLRKDDLTEQSDECVSFLADLLK